MVQNYFSVLEVIYEFNDAKIVQSLDIFEQRIDFAKLWARTESACALSK